MRDKKNEYIIIDSEEGRSDHFISDSSQWKENKTAYFQLFLLSLSSFGAHFSRHALAVLGIFMLQQNMLTTCGLGVLFSTISLPSCILPLAIGYLVDSRQSIFSIGCALLGATCFAEMLFTISLFQNSYGTAFISQFLLGCGATSFTTIQRTMVSFYLQVNELINHFNQTDLIYHVRSIEGLGWHFVSQYLTSQKFWGRFLSFQRK